MVSITEKEFKQFAQYVKTNYGINLSEEKQTLVSGRLNSVLLSKNFKSLT
ncbi:chemotaxis protein CheR, partial [Clostridioides difficile]|nr:chemotaxis protein CheR [Clostridioides difficile]